MSLKVFSRRMAAYRNFVLFILVAIILAAGHQWMVMPTDSSATPSHRSWTLSWKDSALSHFWSGEETYDDLRQQQRPSTSEHNLVDDSEEEDPESDNDGHRRTPRPPQFAASAGSVAFSSLPPSNPRPLTKLIQHAPGWTVFENIYAFNGTLFIITTDPTKWPAPRMIISTSMEAVNSAENIQAREPTPAVLSFITPAEAERMWDDRIWEVRDWTVRGVLGALGRPWITY